MAMVEACRFDIFLVSLDPSQGFEMNKTRPCIIISPNEMNHYIKTLIIAPLTSKIRSYPTRVPIVFNRQEGSIVLDQIRTIDKSRLVKKLGALDQYTSDLVLKTLGKMFC